MSNRAIAGVLRAVRSPASPTDRELLTRFRDGDESAFSALVRRHGAMVFGVCRRALPTVQDAEDACQATFLVLARKAGTGRWQPSIANWLYTTARRTASKANRAAVRRAKREARPAQPEPESVLDQMTGREAFAALDEELDRLPAIYQAPLVLCYLEGLTREDAARSLGVPPATVKSQLDRGRKRLAEALEKRGIVLGAGVLATALTSPAGASPPRLVEPILAAAGGSPSPAVAELARGVSVKTWTKAMLLMAALVGVGLSVARPSAADKPALARADQPEARPAAKADGKAITVTGTVVGPDGRPVAGAAINTLKMGDWEKPAVQVLAKTDKEGKFTATLDPLPPARPELRTVVAVMPGFGPDWVAVNELAGRPVTLKLVGDVPVTGRVTDLEGRPVPMAKVRIKGLATSTTGELNRVWQEWPRNPSVALQHADKELWPPVVAGLPESVTANKDGRFEVRGAGRGRLLGLVFEADGIETAACRVVVDPRFDPKVVKAPSSGAMAGPIRVGPNLYGANFTHAAKPTQVIVGMVTDSKTAKPVSDVQVTGTVAGPHWWENHVYTKTDASGRFRLTGVAKADSVSLSVFPREGQPYFSFNTTVTSQPGLTETSADLKLPRGVLVKGRITEKATGQPVAGAAIRYTALADNKLHATRMAGKRGEHGMAYTTDADGRFRLVVLPGAGILLAQGETRNRSRGTLYTQVRIAKEDLPRADLSHLDGLGEAFSAADGHIVTLHSLSAYKIIEPKETEEVVEASLTFDRGRTVTGRVVGPDSQPATGVTAYKMTACYDSPLKISDGRFTAIALEPDRPRTVLFVDAARKLSATAELRGDEKEPTLTLRPWGKLTGRLLDADGQPIADATAQASARNNIKYMAFNAVVRDRTATTGADGRFTLELPAGGAEYVVYFTQRNKYLNTGDRRKVGGFVVKPGETTDAGDAKVKGE